MSSKLGKLESLVLRLAMEHSDGLLVGQLTFRYGSSVREVFQAYRGLNELGFLRLDDDMIFLTTLGRKWISENQNQFAFSGEKSWRKVPPRFQVPQAVPFAPYAPRRSRLDKCYRAPRQNPAAE